MNRQIEIDINKASCRELAEKYFLQQTGIAGEGEKFDRMRRAAFAVEEKIITDILPRAGYRYYERIEIEGSSLCIYENKKQLIARIDCTAFQQLDRNCLEAVFVYGVSAGNFGAEGGLIMDQLYADIWGTAYTDVILEIFRQRIAKECKRENTGYGISESFGPGFYGMDVEEMKKMPLLLEFSDLGMKLTDSGTIIPVKSCAGILFKVNSGYTKLDSACQQCRSNKKNCMLCEKRLK